MSQGTDVRASAVTQQSYYTPAALRIPTENQAGHYKAQLVAGLSGARPAGMLKDGALGNNPLLS